MAKAQDATWNTNPVNGSFNLGANWSTNQAPLGTAFFNTSSITSLIFTADWALGGFTFNAGASNYTFDNAGGEHL